MQVPAFRGLPENTPNHHQHAPGTRATHFAIHCLASCTFAGTSPLLLLLLAGFDAAAAGFGAGAGALLLLPLLEALPCFALQLAIQARASATLPDTCEQTHQ